MLLIRWLARVGYAPLMLLGANGLAIAVVGAGAPKWALLPLLLAAITLSFLVERLIPYHIDWNESHDDRLRDALHFLVNESVNIAAVLSLPILSALVPWHGVWPHPWPLWLQTLLAVVVADLGITIAHWASHKREWLWRLHAVHHSVKRMYGFNGLMKHPLHQVIELAAGTAPLVLAGISQNVAWLLAFAVAIQLLLQHSNAELRLGPFNSILALAPVHRFHHLKEAGVGDVNFGLFTTIWDRCLGTVCYDESRRFTSGAIGIGAEPNYPSRYSSQLAHPFRSRRHRTGFADPTADL